MLKITLLKIITASRDPEGPISSPIEAEWRTYASVDQTVIGLDNGMSPTGRQAIIWSNGDILLIETHVNEILFEIQKFSFKKMHLKISSAKWRPFVSVSMCQLTNVSVIIHNQCCGEMPASLSVPSHYLNHRGWSEPLAGHATWLHWDATICRRCVKSDGHENYE